MAKVFIQLVTKTSSLDGRRIEIESDVIPRAGELIDVREYLERPPARGSTYIVKSVIYKLTQGGFVPHVTAQEWWCGYRSELLEERGWLPGADPQMVSYDEDDPALNDPRG